MSEYFFPVPGSELRRMLDRKARRQEEFSEAEATMDVMLALDRGDLRPQRYYARRWGWSKGRTARALSSKRSDNLQGQARRWRRFGKGELTDDGAPKGSQQDALAGQERGAGGASAGQERGASGAQLGRKSAPESRERGGAGHDWGAGGAQVGQERGAGGASVGQYSTEADTDTYSDTEEKQQQTSAREADPDDGGGSAAAAADSENPFGLSTDEKQVARQLYGAGVTNSAHGVKGGAAANLVVEYGAEVCQKQLRNLSLRQQRGFQPDQGTGAWLVAAIEHEDGEGYDLPGEKKPSRDGRHQKHRGDGQAGSPPSKEDISDASPRRRKHRPPEHEPSGPAEEAPGKDLPDDVKEQLSGLKEQAEERREQLGRCARNRRSVGLEEKRLQLFQAHFHTDRWTLEPMSRGLLLAPPIWNR